MTEEHRGTSRSETAAPPGGAERKAPAQARQPRSAPFAIALGHPLRAHILARIGSRPRSPREIATQRGEPLAKIAYHFQVLKECGYIEPLERESDEPMAELPYRRSERGLG